MVVTGRSRLLQPVADTQAECLDFGKHQELGIQRQLPGGVVLRDVAPGSAAARRNVASFVGSRLVRINDTAISNSDDVRRALDGVAPGEVVSLHFQDNEGAQRVVNVRMP